MKDDTFTLLASALLGTLQMSIFFGFDIITFTVESMMHSVQARCPDCIIDFAGYYGQCILYVTYTFSNLVAPVVLERTSTKTTIVLGTSAFTLFCASFLLIRTYIYFIACAIVGVGYALYYVGAGAYGAKHSTPETFSRNTAIYWMLAGSCMIPNSIFMIVTSELAKSEAALETIPNATDHISDYRNYSDSEIRMLTLGTVAGGIISIVLAIFLPNRTIADSIYSKRKAGARTMHEQFKTIWWALAQPGILKLAPIHLFTGFFAAFWLTVYTTTVAFTSSFAIYPNLIAYTTLALACGEICFGATGIVANRYVKDFGMWPALSITSSAFCVLGVLLVLFVPPESTMHPTSENSFFEPCVFVAILMGFLEGIVDGSINNCRMVASAKALPSHPAIAFSIAKFYQAIGSAFFYYFSSLFTVTQLVALLSTTLLTGIYFFNSLTRSLDNEEQKLPQKVSK